MKRPIFASSPFRKLLQGGALSIALLSGVSEPSAVGGSAPLSVEMFGCTAIRDTAEGRYCVMTSDARLTFWVPGRCSGLQVTSGTQFIPTETLSSQSGCQVRIMRLEKSDGQIINLTRNSAIISVQRLDFSTPNLLEWKKKVWDRAGTDLDETIITLERRLTQPQLDIVRLDYMYAHSLALLRLTRREDAIRELGAVADLANYLGYRSIAFEALYRKADLLVIAGNHIDARNTLTRASSFATPGESRSSILLNWEDGIISRAEGQIEAAAAKIESAMASAERVNDLIFQRVSIGILADLWSKLNHSSNVASLLERTESILGDANECTRTLVWRNMAYATLHLPIKRDGQGRLMATGDLSINELFRRALENKLKCKDESSSASLFKGLAFVAIQEGRFNDASAWISATRSLRGMGVVDELDLLEIEGLLATGTGAGSDALHFFEQLEQRSRQFPGHFDHRIECTVAVGKLQALRLMGKDDYRTTEVARACISGQSREKVDAGDLARLIERARTVGLVAN